MNTKRRRTIAVVGHGMVGHRVVEGLVDRGAPDSWDIVVFGEEPLAAYDRVHLSALFEGSAIGDLNLLDPDLAAHPTVEFALDDRVVAIDREGRHVVTARGRSRPYDVLVLATGSYPFVPAVGGHDLPGCFVYRTVADVQAIRTWTSRARRGIVVGGGLLGLEAAYALHRSGIATEVVEVADRLMPVQIDEAGGAVLRRRIEALGVGIRTSTMLSGIEAGTDGAVAAVQFSPVRPAGTGAGAAGDALPPAPGPLRQATDMVVFAAGVRPRDDLARDCGLAVGERGGIVVDGQCRTTDPAIFAVGECALAAGAVYGLVSPGYQMARVVAETITGGDPVSFNGADLSTKLKLLGVGVASFGDAHATGAGCETVSWTDIPGSVHKRLVLDAAGRLVGGILVGDTTGYEILAQMARGELPTPDRPAALIAPDGAGATLAVGVGALADTATVCSCENITKGVICSVIARSLDERGTADVAGIKAATRAGTGCGGCGPQLHDLVRTELARFGLAVDDRICEHFAFCRQELFDLVRMGGITTFAALLAAHGTGRGCEICKPAVASILASTANRYILDDAQAGLQDTNDHFLANMQRDGTYSVIPRVPGGEISPEKLIALGEVARDFGLYTKITGGQRIDLLGSRVEQLPAIWSRLLDAGFESGHAYGKAVRTVKSCVGTNWCRYGVGDSTTLAIDLELRYRGLRAPHKLKLGVSGCSRECAEAQAKDVGVIATERGWNLYVGGNGGIRPRHADLLAAELDTDTLVRTIDRFLMFYVRTADRLQRTAPWLEHLEGGVGYLRRVVMDDVLGLCAELDADMQHHVESYACEWRATLDDPGRLRRFRTFINSDEPDPDIVFVRERDQPRPATTWEKVELGRRPR